MLLRARRLDRRVEGEEVRLSRDARDGLGEHPDAFRHPRQSRHRRRRRAHFLADRSQRRARAGDPLAPPLRRPDESRRVDLHQLCAHAE